MHVNIKYINSTRGAASRMYRGCTSGGVYGPCFYTHARWEYRRRLGSLLLSCYVFRALINSLVCWFCTSALGLVLFQICSMDVKHHIYLLIRDYYTYILSLLTSCCLYIRIVLTKANSVSMLLVRTTFSCSNCHDVNRSFVVSSPKTESSCRS